MFSVGQTIYFLSNYRLLKGTVEKVNLKTLRIKSFSFTKNIDYSKVIDSNESIAIIWEMWKGVNGRGGYRVERELYPNERTLPSLSKVRLAESSLGIRDSKYDSIL